MSLNVAYSDGTEALSRDVAWWIAQCILEGSGAPTWRQLRSRFRMSRATSYRWQRWGLDQQSKISARSGGDEQD